MAVSRMDRARAIMSGARAALAVAPLAVVAANATAATFTVGGVEYGFPSGAAFQDASFKATTFANGAGVKMHGGLGPISGADWDFASLSGYEVFYFGTISGPIVLGEFLRADVYADVEMSSGTLQWYYNFQLFLPGGNNRFISISSFLEESGPISLFFTTSWPTDIDTTGGSWSAAFGFQWINMGLGDEGSTSSLTFTVPDPTTQFRIIPAPGGAAALALAGLCAIRRRR